MGCAYGRDRASEEEAAIQAAEDALGVTRLLTEDAIKKVKASSPTSYLSTAEFTRLVRNLDLPNLTPKQNELFKQFQRPDGYSKQMILLLVVLQTQGAAETKAKLLFTAYSQSGQLLRSSAYTMVSDMVQIAVCRTTILVEMTEDLKAYLKKLNEKASKASFNMLDLIMGKKAEVSEEQFLEAFQAPDTARLLTCKGIRNFISGKSSEK